MMHSVLLEEVKSRIYVPGEESWRGSYLEMPGALPGRFDQVIRPEPRPYQSGRALARGMVLESKTKCFMRKFARIVLLHGHLCLPDLFLTGVCRTGCSLASCRSRWHGSGLRSSGSVGKRVPTKY
jgi:hypothetical protein